MEVMAHPHGSFCLPELNTPDMELGKSFYGKFFAWKAVDIPGATGGHSFFQLQGKDVAGLRRAEQGPHFWLSYLSIGSADRAAARAQELGATLRAAPFDMPGTGRLSVLQDPTGGVVGLWEARERHGAQLVEQPGTMWWNELLVHDVPAARRFYSGLFGWSTMDTHVPNGPYTIFTLGAGQVAGLIRIGPDWGPVMPHWQVFFAVDDCDAGIARAKALGGSLVFGPQDVPNAGRFAVLTDAGNAVFAIMKPASLVPRQDDPAEGGRGW